MRKRVETAPETNLRHRLVLCRQQLAGISHTHFNDIFLERLARLVLEKATERCRIHRRKGSHLLQGNIADIMAVDIGYDFVEFAVLEILILAIDLFLSTFELWKLDNSTIKYQQAFRPFRSAPCRRRWHNQSCLYDGVARDEPSRFHSVHTFANKGNLSPSLKIGYVCLL